MDLLETFTTVDNFFSSHPILFMSLIVWSLFWKAQALWRAAQLSHRWWFVFILVGNTAGILEIIYLYFVARKYTVRVERV